MRIPIRMDFDNDILVEKRLTNTTVQHKILSLNNRCMYT
jgi:hypothetical protein